MSRALLALAIALLLAATAAALPHIPRHVNPSRAREETPLGAALARLYASLFASIGRLNLENATRLLNTIEESYVPPELRYVFSRFNDLLHQLVSEINASRHLIEEARESLAIGAVRAAETYLGRARLSLEQAWATYREAAAAASQLARLGIPPRALSSELKRCEGALRELGEEVESLLSEARSQSLVETRISLSVEPRSVVVGEKVRAWGCLETAGGRGLPNRVVEIHVGPLESSVRTNRSGCFSYEARILLYRHRVPIYAEYIPRGGDRHRYTYARSRIEYVHVAFVETPLRVELGSRRALPGSSIPLRIETAPNTTLRILQPFAKPEELRVGSSGSAELLIRVPPTARSGRYIVLVEALPHGVYGPSRAAAAFVVYRLRPSAEVSAPSTAFSGLPLRVEVRTEQVSRIWIEVPALGVSNSSVGTRASLDTQIPLGFLEPRLSIVVRIEPLDPRYGATELCREVRVYSTPCIALAAAPAIAIPIAAAARRRRPRERPSPAKAPSLGTLAPARPRDPVIELLLRTLSLLARVVGRAIRGSETLREYASVAKARLSPSLRTLVDRALRYVEEYLYGDPAKLTSSLRLAVAEALRKLVRALGGGEE